MYVSIKSIIKGLLSYTPLKPLLVRQGTGGTNSARYCYSVWLRHLIHLYENGMTSHPRVIAELGPGDSLGIGLAALLTGAEKYYAFDIVKHTDLAKNILILKDLISLFKQKASIPNENEFPEIQPKIKNYDFPKHLFNFNFLDNKKIEQIEKNLRGEDNNFIEYIVPWYESYGLKSESVDLIYSQAVMEHILELESTYNLMYQWLKKGGYISHQIDYRAHETHKVWNGHWTYGNFLWKIIMHGRSYPINRVPHSVHIRYINNAGFKIKNVIIIERNDGFTKAKIHPKFSKMDSKDLITSSAHIIAQK